jgi:hypothetical protein
VVSKLAPLLHCFETQRQTFHGFVLHALRQLFAIFAATEAR